MSFTHTVNYIIINDLLCAVARFLAAPIARYLVHLGGRDLYATAQVGLATASLLSALKVAPKVALLERWKARRVVVDEGTKEA